MSQDIEILPVFVSSTSLDLRPERDAVRDAVLRIRETQFVGMEYFGSRDETTRTASLDEVDRSRVYVGIVAARYGSGITEAEYDRASELGLPRFIYVKDDATIPGEWREKDPTQTAKLDAFRKKLRANHLEGFDFKSPEDLAAKVTADLHRWLFDNYLTSKLQGALSGEVSRDEAQTLLGAVRDLSALDSDLVALLQQSGFTVNVAGRDIVHGTVIKANNVTITDPDFFKSQATSHEQPFDYEIYKKSHWGDLKSESIYNFLQLERVKKQEDYNVALNSKQQFEQFEFVRDGAKPMYGTVLCFGESPNSIVAGCVTRCYYWRDSDQLTGFYDSKEFKKDLISQFKGAVDFLTKHLRLERVIGQEGSRENYEVPLVALREAIANALIHRVYKNRNDEVAVNLFEDRIEIKSPGRLPDQVTIGVINAGTDTYPRNPLIARVFYLYGHVERAGTGIKRMTKAMLARELPAPIFKNGSETFTVTLKRPKISAAEPISTSAQAEQSAILHQLRAPVGDFVGREKEIDELLATLRGGASAAISGISGMGGIGKTELAFYVAENLRDDYPDAQLVLDMLGTDDPPRDPRDALAACIRSFLGVDQPLPDDLQELTGLYRSILEGKRVLILLDNAFDSAQVRPLLPPAGSTLIITSRNAISLPRMARITLEQLQPFEARELLRSIAPRVLEDTADRICFLCGYLPLAIRAAGSLLDVTADLAPAVYAEQLQDERRRLEVIGAEGVDLGIEASFGLSYARLPPDAARVFRRLAVFPASFDARAEEVVCEDEGHKHLSDLLRRNLVLYNADTQRYSLHDLARLFADSRMSDDEGRATRMRHAAHYLTVLEECDDFYLKGGDAIKSAIALFDFERRNIEAGQVWACRQSSGDEAAARLCNQYPNAGAYVLSLRLHPREFISWLEAALAAARQLKDRASEGRHLGNLGLAYADLGEARRTIEFHEQALLVSREIGDHRGEGQDLNNLGIAYAALGETHRAIEFFEQRLAIAREIGDRYGEGNVLGSLGIAYKNLGETRRAIEFHEQALLVSREIGDRRGEGQDLGNLGVAYAALGETRRAIEFHEQDLAIEREIGDRRGEGDALGNLGNAYADLGETRRAVEFYEQQLTIAREVGDRRGEGNALFNTGLALGKFGERAKAIAHVEAALEIYDQIESPFAGRARAQLAQWRGEA
jgi:tetratricopeptide (TPR) repeat protein